MRSGENKIKIFCIFVLSVFIRLSSTAPEMYKHQNYSRPLSAVEILSALTLLHNRLEEETHLKLLIPNETLTNSFNHTIHRKRHTNQIRLLRKGESNDFHFGNHSTSIRHFNKTQSGNYPIFRFYSLSSRGYLADDQSTHVASTESKDPLSSSVEWEWITVPTYYAVYLRQKKSQRYLCFNRNGRPSMMKNPLFDRCLLRINALIRNPTLSSGALSNKQFHGITMNTLNSKLDVHTPKRTRRETYRYSHLNTTQLDSWFKSNHSNLYEPNNLNSTNPELTVKLQWKHKIGETLLERIKRRSLQVPIPQLSWITTAAHLPIWRLRFCANGMPFIYRKPTHERCSYGELPRLSDIFVICPSVPNKCRIACGYKSSDSQDANEPTLGQNRKVKCDSYCKHAIACRPPDQAAQMRFDRNK